MRLAGASAGACRLPHLVPNFDGAVHVVLDDFGKLGRAYASFAVSSATC